ncbi:hypothetical protein [[Mycobacterium] vasticus]|uniref:Uncharacterized protein n=1 Tax=[Mycobacterium] vasticus TaxID=2875777 RepID=A0ABU5YWC0_9MYCO|nr:hypothetical protein [Mycolicibacter sp. MYC017]MEB3068269.1 hypothetical protein [Mycolicibacter sp. MYC017]
MPAKRGELVPRPPKKTEYEIRYATADAAKGWQNLAATIRNPLADAWDFLTRTPLAKTPTNYPLRGVASECRVKTRAGFVASPVIIRWLAAFRSVAVECGILVVVTMRRCTPMWVVVSAVGRKSE